MKNSFEFRLYVAGQSPNSLRAVANLRKLCDHYLPGRHSIDIVDVLKEPCRALAEGVLLTPTLFCIKPDPPRQVIGNLEEENIVLTALGLPD